MTLVINVLEVLVVGEVLIPVAANTVKAIAARAPEIFTPVLIGVLVGVGFIDIDTVDLCTRVNSHTPLFAGRAGSLAVADSNY